ncbi:hypothetical protein SLEP1_g34694 [Rubroshorea leprosula]|uniref:Uncharacterized protein n=1 Tax=Rubroshorea leprosula TaxID=152421 RepID=A0AAV5KL51_9ROSI|nr:hypothetical protein SLEP1_g34694 [Rubroshorea leprosula]
MIMHEYKKKGCKDLADCVIPEKFASLHIPSAHEGDLCPMLIQKTWHYVLCCSLPIKEASAPNPICRPFMKRGKFIIVPKQIQIHSEN